MTTEPITTPWLRQFNAKCDQLAREQETLLLAMRQRRADILGISVEELLERDNRAFLVGEIVKSDGVSWDEAESRFELYEARAAEERERERLEAHQCLVAEERHAERTDL